MGSAEAFWLNGPFPSHQPRQTVECPGQAHQVPASLNRVREKSYSVAHGEPSRGFGCRVHVLLLLRVGGDVLGFGHSPAEIWSPKPPRKITFKLNPATSAHT